MEFTLPEVCLKLKGCEILSTSKFLCPAATFCRLMQVPRVSTRLVGWPHLWHCDLRMNLLAGAIYCMTGKNSGSSYCNVALEGTTML